MSNEITEPSPLKFGYVKNPEGVKATETYLSQFHPPRLMDAAPHLMADGKTGDLMPYLAYYEVEVKNSDGTIWKPREAEPPYEGQTGNNCTGISTTHCLDALMFTDAAQGRGGVKRTATEAIYAFGLYCAGMRGDNGCYGAALAKAVHEIGAVSYEMIGGTQREDHNRLIQYARNPSAVVQQLRDPAAKHKCEVVKLGTVDEYFAWIANGGVAILPSDVGFGDGFGGVAPRDARGIIRARGSWPHQMFGWGVIRSDGVETVVIFQSWGKNTPSGPQPFRLPSFAFRVTIPDFQRILDDDDVWGLRSFQGFEPAPLPSRWTNADWLTI
jgi:hypothetical protein